MSASSANIDQLITLRDWLRYAVSRFNAAKLFFGHGSSEAYDEAAYLLLHALKLPLDRLEPFLDARLLPGERALIASLIERRTTERIPAAYLTNEAWLGDYGFYVDQRVIVPRSYFAELIAEKAFAPWLPDDEAVTDVLDLCTGSGCLAILLADAFPNAKIDAVDVSAEALEVACRNVQDYALESRIRLVRSDGLAALENKTYDLIVCNPPYVTAAAMESLPDEYRHEPEIALAAGSDGLDFVRHLLAEARSHLKPHGILAVEVGHNRNLVDQAWPDLPLVWLSSTSSEDKIFLIERDALA